MEQDLQGLGLAQDLQGKASLGWAQDLHTHATQCRVYTLRYKKQEVRVLPNNVGGAGGLAFSCAPRWAGRKDDRSNEG